MVCVLYNQNNLILFLEKLGYPKWPFPIQILIQIDFVAYAIVQKCFLVFSYM